MKLYIDSIYETIPSTESTLDYLGVATMSNDAYTHSQETKCCHSPPAVDFNASSNDAYVPSEKVLLSMQNNSSYQVASPRQFMATVTETQSEGSTKKHQCCDKQSIENIQQTDLLCGI